VANVLLVVLDTVRAESLSLYGYLRPTTARLDERARAGVVFDRAVATAPWTLPTHGSLLTGRYPFELLADWEQPLGETYPTLAEVLGSRGYATGGFVANLMFTTRLSGLDRGFLRYSDHPLSLPVFATSAWTTRRLFLRAWKYAPSWRDYPDRKYAEDVNREFLFWLDRVGDRPFFAFLNYFDAHEPYELHGDILGTFPPEPPRTRDVVEGGAVRELPYETMREIDAYDTDIAYIDRQLESLFLELERRGVLQNTLVIVTSDHGEHLGDRGLRSHGNSLYSQLVRVPLVFLFDGRLPRGVRIDAPVSLRAVPATIVDLVGLDDTPFPGTSLAEAWSGAGDPHGQGLALSELTLSPFGGVPQGPIAAGAMKSLVLGTLHYIRNGDGTEELYDLASDPREFRDLSETDIGRAELARLRSLLDPVYAADTLPRPGAP
jgi:arylsulfatase A-like enzyme